MGSDLTAIQYLAEPGGHSERLLGSSPTLLSWHMSIYRALRSCIMALTWHATCTCCINQQLKCDETGASGAYRIAMVQRSKAFCHRKAAGDTFRVLAEGMAGAWGAGGVHSLFHSILQSAGCRQPYPADYCQLCSPTFRFDLSAFFVICAMTTWTIG